MTPIINTNDDNLSPTNCEFTYIDYDTIDVWYNPEYWVLD